MNQEQKDQLRGLKRLPIDRAKLKLYFVRRRMVARELAVMVYSVQPRRHLEQKLREVVKNRLSAANEIRTYEPVDEDQDDALLATNPDESNWSVICDKLENVKYEPATDVDQLKDADMYIAEFLFGGNTSLYAGRKLPERLSAQVLKYNQWIFDEGRVETLEDKRAIKVSLGVDFFAFGEHVFAANKVEFERVMNIREGMIRKRDQLIALAKKTEKFEGLDQMKAGIGDHAILLRRAAQAARAGNLTQPDFISDLFAVITAHPQWGIEIKNGKIVVTEEKCGAILYLLNDARAESFIKHEIFDAPVKRSI